MAPFRGHRVFAVGVCVAAVLALAACGGSKHKSGSVNTTASAAPTGGGAASPADAPTTAAVTTTFVTLFNGTLPVATRLPLLQNSETFATALASQASSPILGTTSATVSAVTLASPKVAHVTYTLSVSGTPLLQNQTGIAVQVDGGWKVSAATFCALLSVAGQAPAACQQASVTALPS